MNCKGFHYKPFMTIRNNVIKTCNVHSMVYLDHKEKNKNKTNGKKKMEEKLLNTFVIYSINEVMFSYTHI